MVPIKPGGITGTKQEPSLGLKVTPPEPSILSEPKVEVPGVQARFQ